MKKDSPKKASPHPIAPDPDHLASLDVAQADAEKAKRAQAAEPDLDPPEPGIDPTLPTNPVRGAPGHQVPDSVNEDEDAEGRSIAEQLAEDGAEQAERDKVRQAARKR